MPRYQDGKTFPNPAFKAWVRILKDNIPITDAAELNFIGDGVSVEKSWDKRARIEILTAGSSGGITPYIAEGPDIDLVVSGSVTTIGRGGDTILLFDSGGSPLAEYAATSAGFDLALAAATAGDTVWLPSVTISGNHTIPDDIEVVGCSDENTILSGTITNNGIITHVNVTGTLTIGTTGRTEYQQILTVAPAGADFTTIQAAINAISDATSTKRYLVKVGAGTYAEQVTMKSWVDVCGAGKHATQISYGSDNGAVIMASNTQLEGVLIPATATATHWGIVITNCSGFHIRSVDVATVVGNTSYVSQGIKITGDTWETGFVEDCIISSYTTTGWNLYMDGADHWVNFKISNSWFLAYASAGVSGGNIYMNNMDYVQMRHCFLATTKGDCLSLNGGTDIQITSVNMISDTGYPSLNTDANATVYLDNVSGWRYSVGPNVYGLYQNNDTQLTIIEIFGKAGGNNEGLTYRDTGGSQRYAVLFPGSDVVALTNRAANGVVQVRANTSTAGAGGEVTVVTVEDDLVTIGQPTLYKQKINTITAGTTTLNATYDMVLCNATGGAITVNLPAAATNTGQHYTIKKIDSSANTVTIDGNASETIDDQTTQVISFQYTALQIVCDGSEWWIK